MSDPKPIYLIVRYDHGRDRDNYRTCNEELQTHYGFFTRRELAEKIVANFEAKVNESLEKKHQQLMGTYRAELARYEQREVELATLRAAGVSPTLGQLRRPLEPKRPRQSEETCYTTYEVVEIELNGEEWG